MGVYYHMKKILILCFILTCLFFVKNSYASSICTVDNVNYELGAAIEKFGNNAAVVVGCCKQTGMCGPGYAYEKGGIGRDLTLIAAENNYLNALKFFIEQRDCRTESWPYDVEKAKEIKDYTPLMWAVKNNNYDMVKYLLLKNGISVKTRNQWGKTALDYAEKTKNDKLIKLIADYDRLYFLDPDRQILFQL